jgi:ABC-2 type transport system ATP-binding protein
MADDKKEKYWSRYACGYDKGVEYIVGKELQKIITKKLSNEQNLGEVIEFGCGTGYFTKILAKNSRHIIASDLSDEMLEVAKSKLKKFKNITVKKADCEDASFKSEKFDTVVLINVIHFIRNSFKSLQESYRILKNNGLLLLIDYTGYGMNRFEKMKLALRFIKKCGMPPKYAQIDLSPDKFNSLVENAGFKVEENQIIGSKIKALYLRGRKI